MDESDTQLAQELKELSQEEPVQSVTEVAPEGEPEAKPLEEVKPKMFDEAYVQGLRKEAARYRRELREEQQRNTQPVQPIPNTQGYQGYPNTQGQPVQPQEIYDPRVDDMILNNKLSEIKADPDFEGLFDEVDEEGITFQERFLEEALNKSWPIDELDALALKMSKGKIFGKVRQKAVDEAYKSMSSKAAASAERNVSSGKNVEEAEVETIDDAIKKSMKEHGVKNLSEVELR